MHGLPALHAGAAPAPGSIPCIKAIVSSPTGSKAAANRRLRGLASDEALAIAQLRRYGYDRRAARLGNAATDLDPRGRPGSNGGRTNRYDARIVRVVDFDRALSSIGGHNAAMLQMYYCDGEDQALVAEAIGVSIRTLHGMLPKALQLLVSALETRLLL